ncbi:MAG: heavy-metal-associated domain-containing protein, partial [Candidatus Nezhaarchaeota archaeon]|nr:heavy-metal-associated domain-containing protein [Candidatus Nezhaarchaeota archaeon]
MSARERIRVLGVDCPSCAYAIRRELERLGCVYSFSLDVESGLGLVEYDPQRCSLRDVYLAIRYAGYDVEKASLEYSAEGLEAEELVEVERRLRRLRGVLDARASPITGALRVSI